MLLSISRIQRKTRLFYKEEPLRSTLNRHGMSETISNLYIFVIRPIVWFYWPVLIAGCNFRFCESANYIHKVKITISEAAV